MPARAHLFQRNRCHGQLPPSPWWVWRRYDWPAIRYPRRPGTMCHGSNAWYVGRHLRPLYGKRAAIPAQTARTLVASIHTSSACMPSRLPSRS